MRSGILWSILILVTGAAALATVSCAAENAALGDSATALIIIDVQDFYFPGGAQPLQRPEAAAENAGRLLAAFRSHGRLVVHVGHQVRSGGDFHSEVEPLAGEPVVMKTEVNAFQGTELLDLLRDAGIRKLVLCGMQTHMCLEGAVRAAADFGFECLVVGDACATRDLTRNEVLVPAAGVHEATLATLDGIYAEVLSTSQFLSTD